MKLQHNIYQTIRGILQTARKNAYKQVNFIMVEAYWNIGKQIVEEEQIPWLEQWKNSRIPEGIGYHLTGVDASAHLYRRGLSCRPGAEKFLGL